MLSGRLLYTPSFHLSRNIRLISNSTSNFKPNFAFASTNTQQCLAPLPSLRQDFAPVSKSVMNWIPPQQGLRRLHERFVNIGLVIEVRDARISFISLAWIRKHDKNDCDYRSYSIVFYALTKIRFKSDYGESHTIFISKYQVR